MPIITLTTDFGLKDHYVASSKGMLLKKNPSACIIDVSHEIDCYNISNAVYVLSAAFIHFPEQSIHIISVDDNLGDFSTFLLMKFRNHYFLSADNGTLSLLLKNEAPEFIIRLHKPENKMFSMELFAEAIDRIQSHSFEEIGEKVTIAQCVQLKDAQPQVSENRDAIRGVFMYEDRYGNFITNVTRPLFDEVRMGRDFEFRARTCNLKKIHRFYADFTSDVADANNFLGQALILFNSEGYLQLSIYKGNTENEGSVRSLLGLSYGENFVIQFK